jgi:hypothetical protein
MIYAEIQLEQIPSSIQGVRPRIDFSFVFYGKEIDEKFWSERIEQHMKKLKKPTDKDVFRFFANEGWVRTGPLHFYRHSADPEKK